MHLTPRPATPLRARPQLSPAISTPLEGFGHGGFPCIGSRRFACWPSQIRDAQHLRPLCCVTRLILATDGGSKWTSPSLAQAILLSQCTLCLPHAITRRGDIYLLTPSHAFPSPTHSSAAFTCPPSSPSVRPFFFSYPVSTLSRHFHGSSRAQPAEQGSSQARLADTAVGTAGWESAQNEVCLG